MAFEQINNHTNALAKAYIELIVKSENPAITKERRDIAYERASAYLECMCHYHNTVLKMSKFVSQRQHFETTLRAIAPGFAKGYFGS